MLIDGGTSCQKPDGLNSPNLIFARLLRRPLPVDVLIMSPRECVTRKAFRTRRRGRPLPRALRRGHARRGAVARSGDD